MYVCVWCDRLITPKAYLKSHWGRHWLIRVECETPECFATVVSTNTPLLQIINIPVIDASHGMVMYIDRVYKRSSGVRTYITPH